MTKAALEIDDGSGAHPPLADPALALRAEPDGLGADALRSVARRAFEHLSISDRLLRLGFTHERSANSVNTGEHSIRNAAGELVGEMTAAQAVEFIKTTEAA